MASEASARRAWAKSSDELIAAARERNVERARLTFGAQQLVYSAWKAGAFATAEEAKAGLPGISPSLTYCRRYAGHGWESAVLVPGDAPRYAGVATCDSNGCPSCQAVIQAGRRLRIQAALKRELDAGHSIIFLTLTLRHSASTPLADTMAALQRGWRLITQKNRQAIRDHWEALGLTGGYVKVIEITHGRNGFHPHIHAALIVKRPTDVEGLVAQRVAAANLQKAMFQSWAGAAKAQGLSAPIIERGVDIRFWDGTDEHLSQYLAKAVGQELTGYEYKTAGRSPHSTRTMWQLLNQAVEGDPRAVDVYLEFLTATEGMRFFSSSRSFLTGTEDEAVAELEEAIEEDQQVILLGARFGLKPKAVEILPEALARSTESPEAALEWLRQHKMFARLGTWAEARGQDDAYGPFDEEVTAARERLRLLDVSPDA